jgi:flavin reductase (DIM6/NTAB) family NADH-FMN oxidoreductase RutF
MASIISIPITPGKLNPPGLPRRLYATLILVRDMCDRRTQLAKIKIDPTKAPLPLLAAYPVAILGALTDGHADFTTVAWIGVACSNPPHISTALQHHRHSLKGIRQSMTFSVNIPSANLVKETDYCGLVTGARADKVADCRFRVFYGQLDSAPFIHECPINHACQVVQIINLGSHELIIGKVIESHISEEYVTDGRADATKIKPFLFAGQAYFGLGESLGRAFSVGKEINPAQSMDTLKELEEMRKRREKGE